MTASQDSSHSPCARRTRRCWVNFIFNSTMVPYHTLTKTKKEEIGMEKGG